MTNRLFVYGTLGPGRPNAHVMEAIGGTWETASVRGMLHQEGWGAEMGYPAITVDPTGEPVQGFLFLSENLHEHWEALDAFEGDAYERILIDVELDAGGTAEAWIYSLRR